MRHISRDDDGRQHWDGRIPRAYLIDSILNGFDGLRPNFGAADWCDGQGAGGRAIFPEDRYDRYPAPKRAGGEPSATRRYSAATTDRQAPVHSPASRIPGQSIPTYLTKRKRRKIERRQAQIAR